MARINIEDSLFRDSRFLDLCIKLQCPDKSLGALIRSWIIAQEFWKKTKNGIPKTEWKKHKLNDAIIECGLAEYRGDFIYVCGSENQFKWLLFRIEAGRTGGSRPKRSGLDIIDEFSKQTEANRSKPKPLTLTLTLKERRRHMSTGVDECDQPLIKLWNENCGTLAKAQRTNARRNRLIAARWKENPDPNYWEAVVKKLAASDFCCGKNSTGWRASFDFLLQPNTHLKAIEGNYDNKSNTQKNIHPDDLNFFSKKQPRK